MIIPVAAPSRSPVGPRAGSPAGLGEVRAVLSMRNQGYPGPLEVLVTSVAGRVPLPRATGKVRNLQAGVEQSRYPILVFCDADVDLPPGIIGDLVTALATPGTGLACALPCWTGARTVPGLLLQAWANAQVGTFLLPIAGKTRRLPVTGALVAIPRAVLDEIGGMAALEGYLADDARLGSLVQDAGYRAVARGWVLVRNERATWAGALSAFLRWLVTLRHHTPLAYALSYLTHWVAAGLIWALYSAIRGENGLWAWAPLVLAGVARAWSASLAPRRAGARDRWVALLAPLADLLAAVMWPAPLLARSVAWAGTTYLILGGGRVLPCPCPANLTIPGPTRGTRSKRNSPSVRQ